MKALAWTTKVDDHALLVGLAGSLPEAVLEEQLCLYEASQAIVAKPPKPENFWCTRTCSAREGRPQRLSTSTGETAVGCQARGFHVVLVQRLSMR